VDIKKQYIAYVCSLQNPMETEARLILKAFSFMHANANTFRCFKVPAPHQQNAVDCGPLACMFLLFLTQNDITPVTKLEYSSIPTAAEMRMRMFADIRQGSVTLLAE
jgi:Ulp1 family protease